MSDIESRNKVFEIRRALQRHMAEHAYPNVKFVEHTNPNNNPKEDDYLAAYEAVFDPCDLEHAYLKIAVTDDGWVGIGFETRTRLSARLGRRLWTAKRAFAAGRELANIKPNEIVSFVRLVAQGRVVLQVGFGFGLPGFGSIRAVVSPEDFQSLGSENPHNWDWLKLLSKEQSGASRQTVVRYKPW